MRDGISGSPARCRCVDGGDFIWFDKIIKRYRNIVGGVGLRSLAFFRYEFIIRRVAGLFQVIAMRGEFLMMSLKQVLIIIFARPFRVVAFVLNIRVSVSKVKGENGCVICDPICRE